MAQSSFAERALRYLRKAPRLRIGDLRDNPGARTRGRSVRAKDNNAGRGKRGELASAAKPPLGWIWGDWFKPWQRIFPSDHQFNAHIYLKREYPPMSLLELQRLVDLGWIDTARPIDLSTLCNTRRYSCDARRRQFGVQLTDEGADAFAARVNIEVQWTSEAAIAAVERRGGTVTTAYLDPVAVDAATDPSAFFRKGEPIPRRCFPPADVFAFYSGTLLPACLPMPFVVSDAKSRGYLADPAAVRAAQIELAQKYGYAPPPSAAEVDALMSMKKDPLQIFYGLHPGWIVNLEDGLILKPKDPQLIEYYSGAADAEREERRDVVVLD